MLPQREEGAVCTLPPYLLSSTDLKPLVPSAESSLILRVKLNIVSPSVVSDSWQPHGLYIARHCPC